MRDRLDAQMREMTYKLMAMAPEAPPYPEVPVTKLMPEKAPKFQEQARRSRRPVAVWVAAAAFGLVLLLALPVFLLNRGGTGPVGPTTSAPPTSVPVTSVDVDMTLYFLADYVEGSNVAGPHLVPVRRRVPVIGTVDRDLGDEILAALDAVISGPSAQDTTQIAGITSAIPVETEILSLEVDAGGPVPVVTVDFSRQFDDTTDQADALRRIAQVVYTATQFGNPDIEILVDGDDPDFTAAGLLVAGPQGRDAHRDVLPLIFAEQPLPGDTVTSPVEIVGVSNTFEATLQWRVELADGTRLGEGFATADCGTGCWGAYSINASYTLADPAAGFVVLFEASAQDGSEVNVVRIPVMLEPAANLGALDVSAQLPGGQALADMPIVVESPLRVFGTTDATYLTVNGAEIEVVDGSFTTEVPLQPGVNELFVSAGNSEAAFAIGNAYEITYVPDGQLQLAFIKRAAYSDTGEVTAGSGETVPWPLLLQVDYADWLTGDAANQAAIEDGVIAVGETVPNDYYIRNRNDLLREVPGSESTRAFVVDTSTIQPFLIGLADWSALFDQPESGAFFGAGLDTTPYWLVIDGEGEVLQIVQQYVP